MFDTYHTHSKEYIPYTKKVIEQKAPTDDSIRLYREMEDKIYASLTRKLEVKDTVFDYEILVFEDYLKWKRVYCYKVKLGGENIEGKIELRPGDFKLVSDDDVILKVRDKLIEHISNILTRDFYYKSRNLLD